VLSPFGEIVALSFDFRRINAFIPAANNKVEVFLDFVQKIAVDRREDWGIWDVWGVTGG